MRIGATIILLDGYCYQSYNWKKMRPLGHLQSIIDSLEEYECDEVSIIRPIRKSDTLSSYMTDINIISNINCMTPLSFGGGLRSLENIKLLHNLPIERLIFSSIFFNKDIELINYATELFGHQSMQCLIPFKIENNLVEIFISDKNIFLPIKEIDFKFINKYANEIILYDTNNEGMHNQFEESICDLINIEKEKIIISGGIGKESITFAKNNHLASTIIDNKVLHNEYSIKGYKNA